MPCADLVFVSAGLRVLLFANRALLLGRWGLPLLSKTLYTLPQPQRPSRRVYSSGQDEAVKNRRSAPEPQLPRVAARSGPKPPNQIL